MVIAHHTRYSFAEYLQVEQDSDTKHEYLEGQILAMAGGTPKHSALSAAVITLLGWQLRGGLCRAHSSDLRVRVLATGLATYPDVTVVCGPWQLDPENRDTITNPALLVEVLSPSTEEYDRTDKFDHYKQIESLREYVLVSQSERRLEVRTREPAGTWKTQVFGDGEVAALGSIGAQLDIRALYEAAAEPA